MEQPKKDEVIKPQEDPKKVEGQPNTDPQPIEVDKLKEELKRIKSENEKLRSKDFNFKRLRDLSDEEKSKLSASEIELRERQEKLEEEQKEFHKSVKESNIQEALSVFTEGNEDLKEKVMFHYNRLIDPGETREQILKKMKDAYILATSVASNQLSPVSRAAGYHSSFMGKAKSPDQLTDDQKSLASKLGIKDSSFDKKNPFDFNNK